MVSHKKPHLILISWTLIFKRQVQQLVLTILCRLAGYNPADIIPFLKMTLFELLSQLAFNDVKKYFRTILQNFY